MITTLLSVSLFFSSPHIDDKDQALWLARSCVGEAGWSAAYSGECAAIAHIFRKRAILDRRTMHGMMHRYSAALRTGKRWILSLDRTLRKPRGLKKDIDWRNFKWHWQAVLEVADAFFRRELADPLPTALHFGGAMDRGRLDRSIWRVMTVPQFKNEFYEKRSN